MIKILLCSEGVTDQGHVAYSGSEYVQGDGVIQVFLRRFAANKELDFSVKKRRDIERIRLIPNPKKYESPQLKQARKLAALASMEGCKHIAYHRDEDNNGFEDMYNQVHSYFTVAKDAGIRCIAIVPKHMTESWLLSDEDAFPKVPKNPALPKKPEETWGEKDSDLHPKRYLKRVLGQFNKKATTNTYCEIAEKSCLEVVRTKCLESFGRFISDTSGFLIEDESGSA